MHQQELHAIYWIIVILGSVLLVAFGMDLNPNNRPVSYGLVTPPADETGPYDIVAQVDAVGAGHVGSIRQFSPNTVGLGHGAAACSEQGYC